MNRTLIIILLMWSFCNVITAQDTKEVRIGEVQDTTGQKEFCCDKPNFGVTAGDILALQVIPWYFNRHVADDATAILSWESWGRNLKEGFEWDPNSFKTNIFMHPYHGNLYYNAARSNGYDYWESVPAAFAGSLIWEFFGENNHAAINDWAATSLGGISIGETFHRLGVLIRDNSAHGTKRAWREISSFLVDPVGGFNRSIRGETSLIGKNPKNHYASIHSYFDVGFRSITSGRFDGENSFRGFYALYTLDYGDPFADISDPFDSFQMKLQINGNDKETIGRLYIEGILKSIETDWSVKADHIITLDQIFDYNNNNSYEVGGQSFGASLRSQYFLNDKTRIRTKFQTSLYILSAIISQYVEIDDRDYDFGSGAGLQLEGELYHNNRSVFRLGYKGLYTHTINGATGNHISHVLSGNGEIGLTKHLSAGITYVYFLQNSFYRDFEDIHNSNSEFRVHLKYYIN